jgi:hypothetical protein
MEAIVAKDSSSRNHSDILGHSYTTEQTVKMFFPTLQTANDGEARDGRGRALSLEAQLDIDSRHEC